jgi:hypothetical protein
LRIDRRWNSSELGTFERRIKDALSLLEIEIGKLKAPLELFQPDSLDAIARWASHHNRTAKYNFGLGWIERRNESGNARAELPRDYALPSHAFLTRFRGLAGLL